MKYIKFFALAAGIMGLVACSDDKKDYNTSSEVMVEMASAELTVKENMGIFNVPVELTGNPNGIVTVTVKVEESGVSSAKEATMVDGKRVGNYIVTSKTINIPAEDKRANIQINAIDDDDENDDRTFTITIVKAEGAKIDESRNTTVVTLKDNDKVPYEKLQGAWSLSWNDLDTGGKVSYDVTITGYNEGTPNYGKVLLINGLFTTPDALIKPGGSQLELRYFYNEATDECYVELEYDQMFGEMNSDALGDDFVGGKFYFDGLIVENEQLGLVEDGYIEGSVSADRKAITFTPGDMIGFFYDIRSGFYIYGGGDHLTLTKK